MALGGAERALLGLLNALDTEKVDVDLFINQHTGEFMSLIPKKINLLNERKGYNAIERPMKVILKEGQLSILFRRLKAKWQHRCYQNSLQRQDRVLDSSGYQFVADSVESHLESLEDLGEYDLAISFLQPHNIVLNKVKARKKIAWIHNDFSAIHVNIEKELPVWSKYDNIISISPDCTRSFLKTFPSLENKIIVIENILSPIFIREQAQLLDVSGAISINNNILKLLSIGRFCQQKNFDNLPFIARHMLESGLNNFHWYVIGFGSDEQLIRKRIVEAKMESYITIIGKKENPYPYIKACDIYVQPSRNEGKSITVREAQILFKPVIITNYPTAPSQIKNGVDGIIVPMDNEGCANGIVEVCRNKSLQESIVQYLKIHDYGNESEVEKIYNLL